MECSDAELVASWQRGKHAAFTALVRRWQGPMARFLAHLLGSSEIVSDLCQEVFLRLYHAGPRYRETGAFSTWLYRIALNIARDAGRRRRREPEPLTDDGDLASHAPSPQVVCAQRETTQMVAQAVADLPEPLRLVLILRHYEEMSYEDIARLTGIPASTLKSRFSAALSRLREQLRILGFHNEDYQP
jgi:RNA polymerase sigma-70 factor (ECF subfamily)